MSRCDARWAEMESSLEVSLIDDDEDLLRIQALGGFNVMPNAFMR